MERTWMAVGIVFLMAGVTSAQEVKPPAPVDAAKEGALRMTPRSPDVPGKGKEAYYVIEMRVLERKGLIADQTASPDKIRRGGTSQRSNLRSAIPYYPALTPPAPTAKPVPVPRPPARQAEATSSDEPDLWEDALYEPGVTVLAAPTLAVVAERPATVQIKTEQVFSYLEPLGDGKFEAKRTKSHELGMGITLAIRPTAGDDQYIDVSPVEIHMSTLDGREPVEGLDLEVGKPIIATRSLSTTAQMKLGTTRQIAIPSGPKAQATLLLRVTRMDSGEIK